jgi:hypothetical protein
MDSIVTIDNVETVTMSLLALGFIILFGGLYWIANRKTSKVN